MNRPSFLSDYMEGAHPALLEALTAANLEKAPGYGEDPYCCEARDLIRRACAAPDAAVHFLVGGTQTNAAVIHALLRSWQGVVSARTGHIAVHGAGAVELNGHKVLTLPHFDGKIAPQDLREYLCAFRADGNREHMVEPGMVYISHPTEYGALYSRAELAALHVVCREFSLPLYLDGARLAYALASPENDVTLADLAALCDAFYIGGTKCGALLGEALVIPDPALLPRFFTVMKQHGAVLAKGRVLGLQFAALFRDGLYERIGAPAIAAADRIRPALKEKGYRLIHVNPTNQIFVVLESGPMAALAEKVDFSFFEAYDRDRAVIRFCTSWATSPAEIDALIAAL